MKPQNDAFWPLRGNKGIYDGVGNCVEPLCLLAIVSNGTGSKIAYAVFFCRFDRNALMLKLRCRCNCDRVRPAVSRDESGMQNDKVQQFVEPK